MESLGASRNVALWHGIGVSCVRSTNNVLLVWTNVRILPHTCGCFFFYSGVFLFHCRVGTIDSGGWRVASDQRSSNGTHSISATLLLFTTFGKQSHQSRRMCFGYMAGIWCCVCVCHTPTSAQRAISWPRHVYTQKHTQHLVDVCSTCEGVYYAMRAHQQHSGHYSIAIIFINLRAKECDVWCGCACLDAATS